MEFKPLEDNEIAIEISPNMFKRGELMAFINAAFRHRGLDRLGEIIWDKGRGKIPLEKSDENRDSWLKNGINCEILKPNSTGWQKGKFRINITIEFCPEELDSKESELDIIRNN